MSHTLSVLARRASMMTASEIRELLKLMDRPGLISFAGGIPDPTLFDVDAFRSAYSRALSKTSALQYSASEGYPPLREWIVERMRLRGVQCGVENVLITCGSQQGLDLLAKLLLDPCDTVVTAAPTYLGALQAFNAYEPRFDVISGNTTARLLQASAEAVGSRVKFIYLVPDFANPTGETLAIADRERALAIAEELGCLLVEDAAYSDLRYEGDDLPPLAAITQKHGGTIEQSRVVYCGTFSKTLAPGLRVGWVCGPAGLVQRLTLAKQAGDLHSSTINQMVIHEIAQSCFDVRVEKARVAYREKRDTMLEVLARESPPGMSWTRPEGGLFVWVKLPEGTDGRTLLERAVAQEKVAFVPGQAFFHDGGTANTIRLSFSLPDSKTIEKGIERLCDAVRADQLDRATA